MLSTHQAARLLKRSVSEIRRLCATGKLSAQRVGRDWVIREEDIAAYLPAKRGRPRREPKSA